MSYKALKKSVCEANIRLGSTGLVLLTWGNVSAVSEDRSVMAIKPSGVDYADLTPDSIVLVDIASGKVIDGAMNPSSDTPTHAELYRQFPQMKAITHTHSPHAVAWAQAGKSIPALGTTHADFCYGPVPITPPLSREQVEHDYELNTGRVIARYLSEQGIDTEAVPGVLVSQHGPFTWGSSAAVSVTHAVILEEVARMALLTGEVAGLIPGTLNPIPDYLLDKHYLRKHGPNAYYGQK